MKNILLIFSLFLAFNGSTHEYFFAFAEVEYDEINNRVEATLTVSTHDFEFYLQQKGIIQGDLNKNKSDSLKMQLIEKEILKHFQLKHFFAVGENTTSYTQKMSELKLDGFETNLTGTTEFYMSSEVYLPLNTIEVTFDILMDQHPNQQNKLYLITRDEKSTIDFLPSKKTQLIELN